MGGMYSIFISVILFLFCVRCFVNDAQVVGNLGRQNNKITIYTEFWAKQYYKNGSVRVYICMHILHIQYTCSLIVFY